MSPGSTCKRDAMVCRLSSNTRRAARASPARVGGVPHAHSENRFHSLFRSRAQGGPRCVICVDTLFHFPAFPFIKQSFYS